jgi:hypothetical protein
VEKEVPRSEIILYGTVVADGLALAYIEDMKAPYATPGRGKRPQVLHKGESIGGFVLTAIEPTRITLARDDQTITVKVDASKLRGPEKGKAQASAEPSAPSPAVGRTPASLVRRSKPAPE